MKKYKSILFVALILSTVTSIAQTIPWDVANALNTKYPAASNIVWKHQLNDFSATFELENYKYEAQFNGNGDWKKTQKEITLSALPELIKNNLSKNGYTGSNISTAYVLYFPYVKSKYHIIIAKGNTTPKSLLVTESGKLLKNKFIM